MPQNRLQLSFTLVLTGVTFKFVVNQGLPRISYLTYLDKYVIATMLILTAVSIWHAVVAFLIAVDHNQYDVNLVERYVLVAMAITYIFFNVGFVVSINNNAISRRREMVRLDHEYRRVLLAKSRTRQVHGLAPLKVTNTVLEVDRRTRRLSLNSAYQNPVIQVDEH